MKNDRRIVTANRGLAMLWGLMSVACTTASAIELEAGPIGSDEDARGKCPVVCARNANLAWTGNWRTTVPNVMSVCNCEAGTMQYTPPGYAPAPYPPQAANVQVIRYDNTDFVGNDLPGGSTHAASFDDCAAQCSAEFACAAFTYHAQLNKCYRKAAAANATAAPEVISGMLSGRVRTPQFIMRPRLNDPNAPSGAATSCSIVGTPKCPGCSVSCGPGTTAECEAAVEGAMSSCARDASCKCM